LNIIFPFKQFEFHITPEEPIILPSYKGSTLRGGFGNAFKRVVCALRNKECIENKNTKLLTLNFLTPARIVYNNHLTLDLEFHILIRNLLRRLSLLYYFHCDGDSSKWDFKKIIQESEEIKVKQKSLRWYDLERYSARQATKMKMGGFVGKITFEGNIEPFMPVIRAGEILHVGKGTGFGLGKYAVQS